MAGAGENMERFHGIPGAWLDCWETLGMDNYLNIIKQGTLSVESAPPRLKQSRRFMEEVIKVNPKEVEHADLNLRCQREFMLIAAKRWRKTIEFASKRLRGDREFVLTALKRELRREHCSRWVSDEEEEEEENVSSQLSHSPQRIFTLSFSRIYAGCASLAKYTTNRTT